MGDAAVLAEAYLDPSDYCYQENLAKAAIAAQKSDNNKIIEKVRERLDAVLESGEIHKDLRVMNAISSGYEKLGDFEKAMQILLDIQHDYPENCERIVELALISGKKEMARGAVEESIALILERKEYQGREYLEAAKIARRFGDSKRADMYESMHKKVFVFRA